MNADSLEGGIRRPVKEHLDGNFLTDSTSRKGRSLHLRSYVQRRFLLRPAAVPSPASGASLSGQRRFPLRPAVHAVGLHLYESFVFYWAPLAEASLDEFLQSLGLEKYLISFQAEEVDMTALNHMTDEDLKAMGIPMGPRKKILLALESKG